MRSPPAPDVPTSPKTIMKKPPESSRPVREDSSSRSVSASRQRLPGQGPRYCRCAAIALLDPVSSAVIARSSTSAPCFSASARRPRVRTPNRPWIPTPRRVHGDDQQPTAPLIRDRAAPHVARPRCAHDNRQRPHRALQLHHNAQRREAPSQLTPNPASTDPRRPVQSVRRRGHGLKPLATRRREFWNPTGFSGSPGCRRSCGSGFRVGGPRPRR
jgi:hypothetical protein